MRTWTIGWTLCYLTLLLTAVATAGPNAGGSLIVHAETGLVYTTGVAFCQEMSISHCRDATTGVSGSGPWVFYLLAAFPTSGHPRMAGVTFGIEYVDTSVTIIDSDRCGDGGLHDPDWPDSGTGTSVTWADPETGTVTEVYWFAAYHYTENPGSFRIIDHPSQGATFADDSVPTMVDPVFRFGTLGFGIPGENPCVGELVPFSELDELGLPYLDHVQMKLTYTGPQLHPIQSLIVAVGDAVVDVGAFEPFERAGIGYPNDYVSAPRVYRVRPASMERIIDEIAELPGVTDGNADDLSRMSFMLVNYDGEPRGFESDVDLANGRDLMAAILRGLEIEPVARDFISYICQTGFAGVDLPVESTGSVNVYVSGVRRRTGTDIFSAALTVKNTSGSSVAAPVTVVVCPSGTVKLAEDDGRTCRLLSGGKQFLNLPVNGSLAPNDEVTVPVRFLNRNLETITIDPRVFSGPGTR